MILTDNSSFWKTDIGGLFLKPCPKCGHSQPEYDFWIGCSYDQFFICCMDDNCDFSIFSDQGGHYQEDQVKRLLGLAWNHLKRDSFHG